MTDELRAMAASVGMEIPQAATLMMSAADTIDRLDAENAKLRELVRNLRRVIPADVTGVVIGTNTDHPTYYKFDEAFHELGIEVK